MFFSEDRYDLSEVGRVKLNTYLSLDKNNKTKTHKVGKIAVYR